MSRCPWTHNRPLDNHYHDTEWGVPLYSDPLLFEYIVLDTFQAGVSWWMILAKRENFRAAFDGFVPEIIAGYTKNDIERLLNDASIIRNRLKIEGTISNSRAFLALQAQEGSFAEYLWRFVGGQPIINHYTDISQVPPKTELAERLSKDLKKRGFKYMGPVTTYAFLQAAGIYNDHLENCDRWSEVQQMRR